MPFREENIMRKGEIACYTQFLLFSQCFPKLSLVRQNAVLSGNGLKTLGKMRFENIIEKVEHASNFF